MKMEIKKEEGHYEEKNVNGGFFMNQIKKLIKSEFKTTIKWLFFILQKKQHN
jgi:hypothetical protein